MANTAKPVNSKTKKKVATKKVLGIAKKVVKKKKTIKVKIAKTDIENSKPRIIFNDFSKDYNEGTAVVAVPPAKRMINYGRSRASLRFTQLSFPNMLFSVRYFINRSKKYSPQSLSVGFVQSIPTKLSEKDIANIKIFCIPLPNISNLSVCLPLPQKGYDTIEECTNSAIDAFWRTTFETDKHNIVVNEWSENSKKKRWKPKYNGNGVCFYGTEAEGFWYHSSNLPMYRNSRNGSGPKTHDDLEELEYELYSDNYYEDDDDW